MADTFTAATERFLEVADWLGDEDEPAVTSLKIMAAVMDKRFSAATMAQYGLVYRSLMKKRPDGTHEVDPLEALLEREA